MQRKMEAEEVLLLIMKKLKEYKNNPMRNTAHEKARQKNLMKMFCIYTSLKKRERAKQRLKEQNNSIEESAMTEGTNENCNGTIEQEDSLNLSYENQPCKNDSLSKNLVTFKSVTSSPVDTENITIPEFKGVKDEHNVNSDSEKSKKNKQESTQNSHLPAIPSTSTFLNADNQRISDKSKEESEECNKECDKQCTAAVDGFLIQLGEGLRKLPYRQRSKLEIEFLARLYEVEECLGLLDE